MSGREDTGVRKNRRARLSTATVVTLLAVSACSSKSTDAASDAGACAPDDQDGVIGGALTFDVTVDDTTFTPTILKGQNRAAVTLTLKNAGTKPHGFAVDCLPTPNNDGCPTTSCFEDGATVPAIAPGATNTVTFNTPAVEGIYTFHSNGPGDTQSGQLILQ